MSFSADVLALTPAAYWRLDESSGTTAADSSGNGRNLTAAVAPTWGGTASGSGIGGTSVSGFSTSTQLGSTAGLFGTLTAFTFMAAVKTSTSTAQQILARDQSQANADRHFQFAMASSGVVELIIFNASNAATTVASTPTVNDGTWHLVFGVWTGTQLKLRIDGASAATPVSATAMRTGTGSIWLGSRKQTTVSWVGPWASGNLDEVAVWTSALSDADMDAIYAEWLGVTTGTLAATGPAGVAAGLGTATAPGTLSAVGPAGVVAALGSVTVTGTLAATGPAGFAGGGSTVATVSATGPAGVAALAATNSTIDPWTDGAHGEALLNLDSPPGVLEVTYPAEPAPAAIVEVAALAWQSHESAVVGGDTSGMTSVPLGTPHVWVDGVDVTYFRDVPVGLSGWRTEAPFGWTSTSLTFPQVFHYEERGTGDLSWMRADAPVEVAIVTPLGVRHHRFTGHLTSEDPGVGRGRTECVWAVEGLLWQADHAHHPVPARLDPTDSGSLIVAELMGTPSRRFTVTGGPTGIPSRKRGNNGMTRWQYVTDHLSTAIRDDGQQWTIEPTGKTSFALALKDTTTVHWTVTAGAPGVELDLTHDHHERIDAVYASGVGPDGYAWDNYFFPDLLPYNPPAYLFANPARNVQIGDTDADTLSGDGITQWQRRIRDLGYTKLAVDGVFSAADRAAVFWVQRRRGIEADGWMAGQTWAATWNVGAVGGDLRTVRLPMAWRPEVEPYLYGANGATVGKNPAYDPSIIRHEIDVDLGAGVTKEQGREMAQRILERGADPGIVGTVKLMTCPWEGSRWLIDAGQNVLIRGWLGEDVLCRVVAVDADPASLTVTLTVDSEFRDAMAVVQILERNRESRPDPARRPGNPGRRSRLDQDQVTPFEGESPAGRLPRLPLYGGLWTVWPVPVSEVGLIAKLRVATSGPVSRFAVALFGRPVTANQIAAKVPDPLAASNPWDAAGDAWLDSVGFIEGWGEQGKAAGYGMLGSESDGSTLTGVLYDDAGVPYVSQVPPWVWVALYSPTSCFIEGRIYPEPTQ